MALDLVATSDASTEQLSPDERIVVQMLSVQQVATPFRVLSSFLEGLARRLSDRALRDLLRGLERRGCVVQDYLGSYRCADAWREPAARSAQREGRMRELLRQAGRQVILSPGRPRRGRVTGPVEESLVRDLRHALYRGDEREIHRAMSVCDGVKGWSAMVAALWDICVRPFDDAWFGGLPRAVGDDLAGELALEATLRGEPAGELFAWIERRLCREVRDEDEGLRIFLAERRILEGRLAEAEALVRHATSPAACGTRGWIRTLQGDDAGAAREYEAGIARMPERNVTYSHACGPYYLLTLLRTDQRPAAKAFGERAERDRENPQREAYRTLGHVVDALERPGREPREKLPELAGRHPAFAIAIGLGALWTRRPADDGLGKALEALVARAERCGWRWVEAEGAALLGQLQMASPRSDRAAALHAELGTGTLVDAVGVVAQWERALEDVE